MAGRDNNINVDFDNPMLEEMWWSGVRLWYNDNDFMQAMEVWSHAIESVTDWNENDIDGDVPPSNDNDNTPPLLVVVGGDASRLAPLLLFLAGCCLDSGDFTRARQLCRRCLSTDYFQQALLGATTNNNNEDDKTQATTNNTAMNHQNDNDWDDFAHSVLSEYAATYIEDESIENPSKFGYQFAHWAIQKRQEASPQYNPRLVLLWEDPHQRPGYLYPFLTAGQAVYPRDDHPPWCRILEDHYPTIREEYQRLVRTPIISKTPHHWPRVGAGDHRDGSGQHDASVVQPGGDWREWVLFGSGARPELAPRTCRILQTYCPDAVDLANQGGGEIIFSVLAPQTHIAPHCASTNIRLTAHLGLQVPSSSSSSSSSSSPSESHCCSIQVANETLHWEEGRIIVFDDSFEHQVHNNHPREIRAVLLLRFWHVNLPVQDRSRALQFVLDAKEKDKLRRCNPPLPVISSVSSTAAAPLRHPQGMNQRSCPACGQCGFETLRLVRPQDRLFVCQCGREAPL